MKKIWFLLFVSFFTLISCGREKEDDTTPNLKEKFGSLSDNFNWIPWKVGETIIADFQEGDYKGEMINSDTSGQWLGTVQVKLSFREETLIDTTWYYATIYYLNDIVLIIVSYPGVPHFTDLFYKGMRINNEVRPANNIPEINRIKLDGDYLYIEYYSRVNTYYNPEIPPMYGRYNLISGELILNGERLPG